MYHTPDIAAGLESGMTDKVDHRHSIFSLNTGTDAFRCMTEQTENYFSLEFSRCRVPPRCFSSDLETAKVWQRWNDFAGLEEGDGNARGHRQRGLEAGLAEAQQQDVPAALPAQPPAPLHLRLGAAGFFPQRDPCRFPEWRHPQKNNTFFTKKSENVPRPFHNLVGLLRRSGNGQCKNLDATENISQR